MFTPLSRSRFTSRLVARLIVGAALSAAACGQPIDPDQVAPDQITLDTSWELTANPVKTTLVPPKFERDVFATTDEVQARHAEAARLDRAWYAADGARYDAMIILPNGAAYGRKGEAIERSRALALPSQGELEAGIDALEAHEEFVEKQRIYTDISIDNRSRISSEASLTSFPSRVIGMLSGDGDVGDGGCTGAKVGPRHVLTAAHCVLQSDGDITTSGRFNPGQTNADAINGSIPWSGVFLRDWRISRDYDYALLYLSNTQAVASTGYMGVGYWNSASGYDGKVATLRGYPCGPNRDCGEITSQQCAASPRNDNRCDGWMYTHNATMDEDTMQGNQIYIDNDGSSGQSGSPIYGTVDGTNGWIFGVYWGSNSGNNRGVKFRSSMWNDICGWIADYPSSFVEHPACN